MKTRDKFEKHVVIEEYNKAKSEIKEAIDKLAQRQQNLKQDIDAAHEVQQLKQKLHKLDEQIANLPKTLKGIETGKLQVVKNFLNNKNNAVLANVLENKQRLGELDGKIRENQVKQACENEKNALCNEERKKIIEIFKDELDGVKNEVTPQFHAALHQATEESNAAQIKIIENEMNVEINKRELDVYAKMDRELDARMAKLAPKLKEFEKNFKETHQGNLNIAEKKAAKKKMNEYLNIVKKEDISQYLDMAKELKMAMTDLKQVCERYSKEQDRIRKRIDIKKQMPHEENRGTVQANGVEFKKIQSSDSLSQPSTFFSFSRVTTISGTKPNCSGVKPHWGPK